jgi:anti-anti-sigma factor
MYQEYIKEEVGDVVVETVNLTRATLKEAEQFKQTLASDIELGKRKVVVDLSGCEFIDSTFLGALVVSLKRITTLGGDLKLVGFQPNVRSMFELTRMHRVFESFETIDMAVESFNQ